MRAIFLSLLFFSCSSLQAQFFLQRADAISSEWETFHSSFISANKIKSISISYSSKEDNQRIKSKETSKAFFFNTDGNPIKEVKMEASDTTETFFYFSNGSLSIQRTFQKSTIQSRYFSYDSLGRIVKEVNCMELNAGESREFFKLLRQEVNWLEVYAYQALSNLQLQRNTFNDIGKVYKNAILYSDTEGRIIEEAERFSITGVSQNRKYVYDEAGRLKEKKFYTDVVGELAEKTTFTYDAKGNLIGELFYRNDALQFERIYFYDAKGEFPEAILCKYPNRRTIDMLQFKIELF